MSLRQLLLPSRLFLSFYAPTTRQTMKCANATGSGSSRRVSCTRRCGRLVARRCGRFLVTTLSSSSSSSSSSSTSSGGSLQQTLDANRAKNRRECLPIPTAIIAVKSSGGGDENTLYKKLEQDFETKIKRYTKFEMIATPQNPKNEKTIEEQKESEGERVMKKIDPRDYVVLMCERGKSFTSEKFASDVLAKSGDLGHGRLVFVIGGPFGHGKEVERRADVSLRLSEMVMNHRVARMVLLEQIYRAWTIVRGEPYHH